MASQVLPEAVRRAGRVEAVQVGAALLVQAPQGVPEPGGHVDAVGDGQDLAAARRRCQVALAVRPWSWLTALAPDVLRRREGRHVELRRRSPSGAPAKLQDPLRVQADARQQGRDQPAHEVGVEPLVARGDRACGW